MFRAGSQKSYADVACEIYEPGGTIPVIRMFTRDSATGGAWAGDEEALMNHIITILADRLSENIERRMWVRKK